MYAWKIITFWVAIVIVKYGRQFFSFSGEKKNDFSEINRKGPFNDEVFATFYALKSHYFGLSKSYFVVVLFKSRVGTYILWYLTVFSLLTNN